MFPAYLWGIETVPLDVSISYHESSQPTYEELKPFLNQYERTAERSSQPTYEELKPAPALPGCAVEVRSQPTYEELKPYIPCQPMLTSP
mgnify:CR=1 FL=1